MSDPFPWPSPPQPAELPQEAIDAHTLFTCTEAGRRLWAWLCDQTVKTALPATATDQQLRHLEGQRALVLRLERMIRRVEET